MRRWHERLATLCLATFSIAAVPGLGALSRDQHLDYDEELARLCVIYSSAAYGRMTEWSFVNPECNEKTKGFVLSETYVGDGTDAFGYVGLDKVSERVVVAFKGTSDLRDWMTDLRTWVRYTKRCAPAGTPATTAAYRRNTVEGGGAILPSSSNPKDEPRRRRRRRRRRPRQRASQQGEVASGLEETGGSWEEGDCSGGVGGVGPSFGEAADLLTAEIEGEGRDGRGGGGGGGGSGRRKPAEASGLEPEGEWSDIKEGGGGGERTSAFGEEGEMGALHLSEAAAEDRDHGGWLERPRWWQRLQHFVGGAGTGCKRHHHQGPEEEEQKQREELEELEELEEFEEFEDDDDDDDDDDPKEDELIGNVHFGFCEYYQTLVAEGLADTIARLAHDNPSYSILVTGHSLGAAAAAVCAADLVQRLGIERDRVVLYTLGEPRTGDGIFAEGVNDRVGTSYRVVHDHDVVPHLALCCHGWFGKCKEGESSCPYQHSTEIVYANDMGEGASWLMCNDSIGEDYACDPRSWDLSVSDHQHYFEMPVGLYCATAPEDLTPFPLAQEREEMNWAPYDAEMRVLQGQGRHEEDEDDPFRFAGDRLRNA